MGGIGVKNSKKYLFTWDDISDNDKLIGHHLLFNYSIQRIKKGSIKEVKMKLQSLDCFQLQPRLNLKISHDRCSQNQAVVRIPCRRGGIRMIRKEEVRRI